MSRSLHQHQAIQETCDKFVKRVVERAPEKKKVPHLDQRLGWFVCLIDWLTDYITD